jgi:hypothetical protein
MGRGDFDLVFLGGGLFTFKSNTESVLKYTSVSGEVALLQNSVEASVTVSHNTISGTSQVYIVNLNALEQFGVDLASSFNSLNSGAPLVSSDSTTVTVGVYMSFPDSKQFGALQMEVVFNSAVVIVQRVDAGADFTEDFASEATLDKVGFGGISLATPLEGRNQHIAEIVFRILNTTAVAEFDTIVLSIAEVSGNNEFPTPMYGESGHVWLDFIGSTRHRRSTSSRDVIPERKEPPRTRRACAIFPLGDVNGDCTFDTTDVLLTNAYLTLNGQAAVNQFLLEKQTENIIKRNDSETAMDADFNSVIQLADASYMMYVR